MLKELQALDYENWELHRSGTPTFTQHPVAVFSVHILAPPEFTHSDQLRLREQRQH